MTTTEEIKNLIKESSDCKDIIRLTISNLEEEIAELEKTIADKLKTLHSEKHDEFSLWFWEEYIKVFFVEDLEKKEKNLRYFKSLLSTKPLSAGRITDTDIEEARRTPPEEYLDIKLYNAGSNRKKGLCPFHKERTASFVVYPDGYKCFGCGESGNAIDYIMKTQNIAFKEAVKQLVGK